MPSPARKTPDQHALACVTPTIATILSRTFSVRSGYYVPDKLKTGLEAAVRPSPFVRSALGQLDAQQLALLDEAQWEWEPIAIEIDLYEGRTTRPGGDIEVHSEVRVGDVIKSFFGEHLMVSRIYTGLTGRVFIDGEELISGEETILASVAPKGSLYLTEERQRKRYLDAFAFRLKNPADVRYAWDEERVAFVSLSDWRQRSHLIEDQDDDDQEQQKFVYVPPTSDHGHGFTISGDPLTPFTAHQGDFVYSLPLLDDRIRLDDNGNKRSHPPFDIWRVEGVVQASRTELRLTLRRFKRQRSEVNRFYGNLQSLASLPMKDERLVAPSESTLTLTAGKNGCRRVFVGRCYVFSQTDETTPSSVPPNDTFYAHKEDVRRIYGLRNLPGCPCCSADRAQRHDIASQVKVAHLRSLELFCGAGGLAIGLGLSGAVETRWAIDHDKLATETFHSHHPTTNTLHGSMNKLLQAALEGKGDKKGLPKRGQIDVIAGGPPCQGFSGLNYQLNNKQKRDGRTLMIAHMLSWIDLLRPKFVLIENVLGLLKAKLGKQDKGFVKLILLSLTSLGYSASLTLAQSGSYGCPQSRHRLIFWGAHRGYPLPAVPSPSHVFLGKAQWSFLWEDGKGDQHRAGVPTMTSASLPAITIGDAICDLPPFDWKDPHLVYMKTVRDVKVLKKRRAAGMTQINAHNPSGDSAEERIAIGPHIQPYATLPRTTFQLLARTCNGYSSQRVVQHQTKRFGPLMIERIVNIPFATGANHEAWFSARINKPKLGKGLLMSTSDVGDLYKDAYGRLSFHRHFSVALTTLGPGGKTGRILHPSQHRILTVREHARSQGFPDGIHFSTGTEGPAAAHKQIGNAVAIPFAKQLGLSLLKALVDVEVKKRKQAPPDTDMMRLEREASVIVLIDDIRQYQRSLKRRHET